MAPQPVKVPLAKSPIVLSLIGAILILVVLILALNQPKRSSANKDAIDKIKHEVALELKENQLLRRERGLPAFEFDAASSSAPADVSQRLNQLQQKLEQATEEISILKLRVRELEGRK